MPTSVPWPDPPELVARVRALYESGLTQDEVAVRIGQSQKKVWGVMRRNGITARKRVPRDQTGSRNGNWKGRRAGYQAMHTRVYQARGRPRSCALCGGTDHLEWANLTGAYEDVMDYLEVCRSCHHRLDGRVRNLQAGS